MRAYSLVILLILTVSVAGCNLSSAAPAAVTPATVPHVRIAQVASSPVPTAARDRSPLATATRPPDPTATASFYACEQPQAVVSARHTVVANLDYEAKTLTVNQQTRYRNQTNTVLSEIVFHVEPNIRPGGFVLDRVLVVGEQVAAAAEKNRLHVPLEVPLPPGCEVRIDLVFAIAIPRVTAGISSFKGFFGHGQRQVNLALWLPSVAANLGGDWIVHEPASIGEQVVLDQADWDVTLNVENGPDGLQLAAPGQVEVLAENRWRIVHNGSRDLSLSLSTVYRVLREVTANDVTVEVYAFPDSIIQADRGQFDGAAHALEQASRSLEQFESLFGPYPYDRLVVVQGDFPDGMEFSGLVFVSTAWFYGFDGGADNYLTLITVHEVAHQWWYARVGNDAAYAPWLDEALATYSEYVYFEEYYPELKNWWWSFRVGNYSPQGDVDSAVYEFETIRDYINAVYLRGVQMLHRLRDDIGTEAFFDLLYEYAQAGDGRIASPELFWSLLTAEQWDATRDTRADFLRQPDVGAGEAAPTVAP